MSPTKSTPGIRFANRSFLTLCLCLIALHALAAAGQRVLVVLGSSTAAGIGPAHADSAWTARYAAYLAANAPYVQLQNLAVSGTTTFQGLPTGTPIAGGRPAADTNHNLTRALQLGAAAVIINYPSNDTKNGYPLAEQERNLRILDSTAAAAGIQAWFCTPQPRTELDSAQRQVLMDLKDWMIAEFSPHVIDFWTGLAMADGEIQPMYRVSADGIHLNDAAHGVLFNRVVQAGIPATIPVSITAPARPVRATGKSALSRRFDLRGRTLPNSAGSPTTLRPGEFARPE